MCQTAYTDVLGPGGDDGDGDGKKLSVGEVA
jgi:hypothetical protein